jgi:N utilization substance protein A
MALQARTEFAAALNQLASEKGVDVSVVIEAIEQAALAAYRKDLSLRNIDIPEDFEELKAEINPATGEISIMRGKENITPPGFARIAAQTAKQVILQRLHEAEKDAISEEYEKKVGTIITGAVQRQEGNTYFVDLGRAEGIFPPSEQTRDEYYHAGQRMKFLIKEIREGRRGPEVVVSRTDPDLVKGLFAMEVPEIQSGSVVIKDIAREAGSRTKISAISNTEGVDPVGSLVGQKGVRVQAVTNELGEERVDIVTFSENPASYIEAALSPAKDIKVTIEEENGEKIAKVKVPSSQLSLAIGKGGQNVRLAAKITGYKIDIEGLEENFKKQEPKSEDKEKEKPEAEAEKTDEKVEEKAEDKKEETIIEETKTEEVKADVKVEEPKVEEKAEEVVKEAKPEEIVEEKAEETKEDNSQKQE